MQVSVESLSKVTKCMTIQVPSQRVEEAFVTQLDRFAKNKSKDIKGFRPGKVPLSYVRQRFGQEVRSEAISVVIKETLNEALRQEKLRPINNPRVETRPMDSDKGLEYTATFDIMPEVETVHFKTDSIEKLTATITENDIDHTIELMREQNILWLKGEQRKAAENDKVSTKLHIFMEDGKSLTPETVPLEFILKNESSVFGWNLLEKLGACQAGEEKKFSHIMPEGAVLQGMAGKTLEFKIEVLEVFEPQLPALDEAFAKKLGIQSGDLQELRAEIRKQLEFNLKRSIKKLLKDKVFEKLLEQNPLDIPPSLIEREAKHLHDENCSQGQPGPHHHSKEDEAYLSTIAKQRIQLGLLAGDFASKNKLTPSAERINEYLSELASVYTDSEEYLRRIKADKYRLKEIETFVLEDQIVEKLLENVSIVEKEVSYKNLISQGNSGQEKNSTITQEGA